MNKLTKLYTSIGFAIFSIFMTQNVIASEKYILKVSHTDRANSIKGKFFIRFKELLEEKHPNITVQLNEYGKLSKRKQEIDALELGLIDIIAPDIEDFYEKTGNDKVKLLNLPFLFETNNDYYKFLVSPARTNFINLIDTNKSYIPLSIIGEGYEIFVSKQPILKMSDLHDKHLITSSKLTNQTFYNQLKLKDFEYSDFDNINYISTVSQGNLFEVSKQSYLNQDMIEYFPKVYVPNHKFKNSLILMNRNTYNKLPNNIKKSIKDLLQENAIYNKELITRNENSFTDKIERIYKGSVVNITKEDKEELKKLSQPMHDFYLNRIDRNMILDVYKTIQ